MKLIIRDNYDEMCAWAAQHIADAINNHKENRPFILGLPTGSSPLGVYKRLIEMNKAGLYSSALFYLSVSSSSLILSLFFASSKVSFSLLELSLYSVLINITLRSITSR